MAKTNKKLTLNVTGIGASELANAAFPQSRHMVLIPGYGDQNYQFPDVDQLVVHALQRLNGSSEETINDAQEPRKTKKKTSRRRKTETNGEEDTPITLPLSRLQPQLRVGGNLALAKRPNLKLVATASGANAQAGTAPAAHSSDDEIAAPSGSTLDHTYSVGAEGIRLGLQKGRFAAIVAERFDPLGGAVSWARDHMDAKYQPAVQSLSAQLAQLQSLYEQALPKVLSVLEAQNQQVPKSDLLDAAVASLDQELAEILYVLKTWTDAFAQFRDGMYDQLKAVTFTVEEAFALLLTGDADGACEDGANCKTKLKSEVFQVGNVFLARFSGDGPATLPGTRGPVGFHLIEVPHDERDLLSLMIVLYLHEFRHDVFADISGLAEELTDEVVRAIFKAHGEGRVKFKDDKVRIGRHEYPTLNLLCSIIAQQITEIDADVTGVLLSGSAFFYGALMTFSALNSGSRSIFAATPDQPLLRSYCFYKLVESDGKMTLVSEPHPADYPRMYLNAAAIEELGFTDEANFERRLADQAVGEVPEFITWLDEETGTKPFQVRTSDLMQLWPVVAKAIIRTKLKALDGYALSELINFNGKRQSKVDAVAGKLMKNSAELPTDHGDIRATYVAAGAVTAYIRLIARGVQVEKALRYVQPNALKMLEELRERNTSRNS